jgi:hypothetical protein
MAEDIFGPSAVRHRLVGHGVTYIIAGTLCRLIHGSDELTDGVDIVPSTREEHLLRLGLALDDLDGCGQF